jgi:hypothetical protein
MDELGKAYPIVHFDANNITVLPRREDRPAMLSLRGMSSSVTCHLPVDTIPCNKVLRILILTPLRT